jgi:hypothetical protein
MHSAIPGSDLYGVSPLGPRPNIEISLLDQIHGIEILFNGLFLPDTSAASLQPSDNTKKPSTAAIVGAVIGGIALFSLIAFSIFFFRKINRQKAYDERKTSMQIDGSFHVEPFPPTASGHHYINGGSKAVNDPDSVYALSGDHPALYGSSPSMTVGFLGEAINPGTRSYSSRASGEHIVFQSTIASDRGEKRSRAQEQSSIEISQALTSARQGPEHISTPPASQSVPSAPSSRAPASQTDEDESLRTGRPHQRSQAPDVGAQTLPTEELVKELYTRMHESGSEGTTGEPPTYRA